MGVLLLITSSPTGSRCRSISSGSMSSRSCICPIVSWSGSDKTSCAACRRAPKPASRSRASCSAHSITTTNSSGRGLTSGCACCVRSTGACCGSAGVEPPTRAESAPRGTNASIRVGVSASGVILAVVLRGGVPAADLFLDTLPYNAGAAVARFLAGVHCLDMSASSSGRRMGSAPACARRRAIRSPYSRSRRFPIMRRRHWRSPATGRDCNHCGRGWNRTVSPIRYLTSIPPPQSRSGL